MRNDTNRASFVPLEQAAFQRLEHSGFLKGLLRPFKGKGELELWASQCEQLREQLIQLAKSELLRQAQSFPFALLPVRLTLQTTGAGTSFLRWRNVDRSIMGVHLWQQMMADPRTPSYLTNDLLEMEIQRAVFNMQISLTHTLSKQAHDCAKKLSAAQAHYANLCRS